MIIKGNIRTDGKALANYLKSEGRFEPNREKNERIEIWEAFGIEQGDTLQNILADFQHSAAGGQCEKPLFHVQFRTPDGEPLTREQWLESANRLEERLGLTGHDRAIVAHTLNGQEHMHVVWNRINPETHIAAELHFYKHKCTDVARELERDFGLRQLSNDRKRGKLSRDEEQQALRHGKAPQEVKEAMRACWQQADNGQSFAAALDERGYLLANGDRRDFVIVGQEGEVYSVARVTGSKVAEVRAKLADLEPENLPGVEEARGIQHDRAHGVTPAHELLKWEDDLARAAIEKTEREERELLLAERGKQTESAKDFHQHQKTEKQERDAIHLEAAQNRPEAVAEKATLKKQARQIDSAADKGLKAASRIIGGVTKPIEGVLNFLVGAPQETTEQLRAKVAEKAERERKTAPEKPTPPKTVAEVNRELWELHFTHNVPEETRSRSRYDDDGRERERER